ncbi:MAG: glycosyltransferase [Candidatus Aureabacteria bacterium]|nr:glycosyltransferase [Candidatus Auribacterota bacterium]
MLCSVIIPTFNRKEILKENLAFLRDQKDIEEPFEVLVVDDGSKDGTDKFVESVIKKYPFNLRYFNTGLTEVNAVSVARNIGIKESISNNLIFIDDDFFVYPYFLSFHLKALKKNLIVQGHVTNIRKKLKDIPPVKVEEDVPKRFERESQKGELMELISSNFSVKKDVFDLTGGFDERFARKNEFGYEDIELGQRMFFCGIKMYFEKDALGYVPIDMKEDAPKKNENTNRAKNTWWKIINDPPKDSKMYQLLILRRDYFRERVKEQNKKKEL